MMHITVGALTDVGRVRDHNEDGYLVDDGLGLVAVADGMGGHRGGEVASAIALAALQDAFTEDDDLASAVELANRAVFDRSVSDDAVRGMGTTLTALALGEGTKARLGHVGDSRAYLWRDAALQRLTRDHSLVEELVAAGELTPEEADRDPRRSMITRALGLGPGVDVDRITVDLEDGDRLLLCSDGLTSMISEQLVGELLGRGDDPTVTAQHLVEAANAAGGADNTTVLVIDVVLDDGDELAATDDGLPEAELVEVPDEDDVENQDGLDVDASGNSDLDDDGGGERRRRWPFRRR